MKGCTKDKFALMATPKDKSRFWSKVNKTDTCWFFPYPSKGSYGRFKIKGIWIGAHRCAKLWRTKNTERANLLWACHLCLNKNCVRPSHLYWGTPKQNYADMERDGTLSLDHLRGSRKKEAKLTEKDVSEIYQALAGGGISLSCLAQKYKVTNSAISGIGNRRTWRHVTADLDPITLSRRQRGAKFFSLLDENQVLEIKRLLMRRKTHSTIAREYRCSTQAVSAISSGRNWAHIVVNENEASALRLLGRKSTPKQRKSLDDV